MSRMSGLPARELQALVGRARPFVPPPLPASTVDYWDCRVGIALTSGNVSGWVSRILGLTLVPPAGSNRPLYGYSSAFRNKVVQTSVSSSRHLWTGIQGSPIIASGAKPAIYILFGVTSAIGGPHRLLELYGDNGAGSTVGHQPVVYTASGPDTLYCRLAAITIGTSIPAPSVGVHKLRGYSTASAGVLTSVLDGVTTTGTSGVVSTAAVTSISLGALVQPAVSQLGNFAVPFFWIGSSEPSAAEWTALDSWAHLHHR